MKIAPKVSLKVGEDIRTVSGADVGASVNGPDIGLHSVWHRGILHSSIQYPDPLNTYRIASHAERRTRNPIAEETVALKYRPYSVVQRSQISHACPGLKSSR